MDFSSSSSVAHVALESIQSRMDIQQLLLAGEISKAREKLLDIDKAVCTSLNTHPPR